MNDEHTKHPPFGFPLSLVSALALWATPACDDGAAPADDREETAPRQFLKDPSSVSVHTACVDAGEFAGVPTVIRYPMGANCLSSLADSPLVLVLRGNGYGYDTYDYLIDHLAENGYIAVSAGVLADPNTEGYEAKAIVVEAMLDALLDEWALAGYIDPSRLGIVGHSRGGKLARYVADRLKGGLDPWVVRAIVSLAGNGGDDMAVTGDMTTGLLVLQGAADGDIEPNHNYQVYDLAGTEAAIPFAQPHGLYKAMKLLEFGDHAGFSEEFGLEEQAHVAKGYVLAFLDAHLRLDMQWYETFIRGDAVPHGWSGRVVSQVSDGFYRDVIDDFEDGLVGGTPMNGAVMKSTDVTAAVLDLSDPNDGKQHHTRALSMYGRYDGDSIEWSIPEAHSATGAFEWLSFRIGQSAGVASADLRVQIRNGNTWSPERTVGDHGEVPTPMMMCPSSPYDLNSCTVESFAHMGTVRIPLTEFGAHDDVERVRIVFRGGSVRKTYLLDSLEFSEWDLKP
jgi:dienelactone hydrolase